MWFWGAGEMDHSTAKMVTRVSTGRDPLRAGDPLGVAPRGLFYFPLSLFYNPTIRPLGAPI